MKPHIGKCDKGHPIDDTGVCWQCKQDAIAQAKDDLVAAGNLRRIIDSGALDAAINAAISRRQSK